jgi:ABC-2 type transport system permease protein
MSESFSAKVWRNARVVGSLSYYLGVVPMVRIPTLLPFVFATPFTILFILFVTGRGATFAFGVAGAITMTVSQQGLVLGADLANLKIEHKFQSIVVASPVSPLTYMLSVGAAELAFALPPIIILLAIMAYSFLSVTVLTIIGVLAVILLTWIATSSIGFFLSTYVLNTRTAFLTVTFISILLSVLPPVFYPLQVIPAQLRWVAELVPTTHSSILIQGMMNLPTESQLVSSWIALPVFAIAFLLAALFKARWRES